MNQFYILLIVLNFIICVVLITLIVGEIMRKTRLDG